MVESLVLFEIVIDSRWFLRQDSRLQEPAAEGKLSTNLSLSIQSHISSYLVSQVPFEIYFPDYIDINNTTKYMQVNPARLSIPTVSRVIHLSSPVHDTH